RVFDATAAWLAALAFLSMPLVLAFSRTVIFDSALSFFIVLAIVSFYFAVESSARPMAPGAAEARRRSSWWQVWRSWTTLAWIAISFGVLTKGPVALAVPL